MTAPAAALMVAAPRSGAGKTLVTLALLAALRRRGLRVRAAKTGPDYIDPAFHAAACGAESRTLDSWAMPPARLAATLAQAAEAADLLVIEAAMGLFDGAGSDGAGQEAGRTGAAADIAARFGIPVLLVLDVSGQSQSAAAVARGFAGFAPGVRVAGVVLNRVASPRHEAGIRAAMAAAGLRTLGALPRDPALALPERHLGLVQAREQAGLPARLEALALLAAQRFDLDAIQAIAAPLATPAPPSRPSPPLRPPGQRIALAQDDAFSFIYPHLLEGWRRAGATIAPFSPLDDEPPPPGCDAAWLPGGYPELHAGRLAAAARFRAGMLRLAAAHPVHGECGGFMVLGAALTDAQGVAHPMLGLLGHSTSFARRAMTLGYREATLLGPCALGGAGTVLRGHEFHYATLARPGGDAALADLRDAADSSLGAAGARRGAVSGSFFHVISERS